MIRKPAALKAVCTLEGSVNALPSCISIVSWYMLIVNRLRRRFFYARNGVAAIADENGVWRTVSGRKVFIKHGQSLSDAMRESGKFGTTQEESAYDRLIGKEYTGVRGQAAIDKLISEKQGHVKEAFYRDDIGEIDLIWGDSTVGLCHIIKEREARGISGKKFTDGLSDVIEKGVAFPGKDPDRLNIAYKGKVAVITFDLRDTETTALLTAFHTKK